MPKILYTPKRFRADSLTIIDQAIVICDEYAARGFVLTLRQLYYQFVARGLLKNTFQNYKRLGDIVNDARLAGLIDWNHLEDRTRNLRDLPHWSDPGNAMLAIAQQYRNNRWTRQPTRIEVWIEKDALVGVIERVCNTNDVPYFALRGYVSQSEAWGGAQRMLRAARRGQPTVILHLGDHDPSGIDMTRDNQDRLNLFFQRERLTPPVIKRLALNFDQVQQYNPPPNPTKLTDSRSTGYVRKHGMESWELDALDPDVIETLIQTNIDRYRDMRIWREDEATEQAGKNVLEAASDRWEEVATFLGVSLEIEREAQVDCGYCQTLLYPSQGVRGVEPDEGEAEAYCSARHRDRANDTPDDAGFECMECTYGMTEAEYERTEFELEDGMVCGQSCKDAYIESHEITEEDEDDYADDDE